MRPTSIVFAVSAALTCSAGAHAQWAQMAQVQFNAALSKPHGIDVCAGAIALGREAYPNFNRDAWPIMCHEYRNHPAMVQRVGEIRTEIDTGTYSDADLAKMRQGELWIGEPAAAVVYNLGLPTDSRKSVTIDGVEERWLYRDPLRGTQRLLTFIDGKLVRIDE